MRIKQYFFIIFICNVSINVWGVVRVSVGTGLNWDNAATWFPAGIPQPTDDITIANGHTITMDGNTGNCNSLTIDGTANWAANRTTNVGNGGLTISSTGNITGNVAGVITCSGNISINAVLTSATVRMETVTAPSVTISGTGTIGRFRVSTPTYNDGNISITSVFDGTSSFTNNSGSTLNIGVSTVGAGITLDFTSLNNTVNYNRGGGQTMRGGTYHHLITSTSGTKTLGGDITVNGNLTIQNGIFSTNQYQITGNATGIFTMGTSTTFNIGTTSSTTPITFPTNFIASNIVLNSPSTISYQTNGNQVISTLPEYINLTITSASTCTKTLSGAFLKVFGNLTISSSLVTLEASTSSIDVDGNLAGPGSMSFTTGSLNLGGNVTLSGTFTQGTGTVTYDGALDQAVRSVTYYNLITDGSGTKTLGGNITVQNHLTINNATLDVSTNNRSITLAGNFTNNGTFVPRLGTVNLNGSALQTIGGTSATDFFNLNITNASVDGIVLDQEVTLAGTMTLTAGSTFDTQGNNVTFLSDQNYTGRLATLGTGASFIGNITMQRFIPGTNPGWVFLSAPVSGQTLANWQDDFPTSGFPGATGSAGSFVSVYTYDESVAGVSDNGFVAPSSSADPLNAGQGFMAWVADDFTTTSDITAQLTGTPNTGAVAIPISYTDDPGQPASEDGWNLIGNPYPSPISWSLTRSSADFPTRIDNAIYVWNADLNSGTGGYAEFVAGVSNPAVGSGGIGNTIPSGQAFFIHLTNTATLTVNENIKATGNPTFLKIDGSDSITDSPKIIRLALDGSGKHDETVIRLYDSASYQFDPLYDAYKLPVDLSYYAVIKTTLNQHDYAINAIPNMPHQTIPVSIRVPASDTFTVSANLHEMYPFACVTLHDTYIDSFINLSQTNYSFFAYDTTQNSRFNLIIDAYAHIQAKNPSCNSMNNGSIDINAFLPNMIYMVKNSSGSTLDSNTVNSSATIQNLDTGIYLISIIYDSLSVCGIYTDTIYLSASDIPLANFSISQDSVEIEENTSVFFNNLSQNYTYIQWDFGDSMGNSQEIHPFYFFEQEGTYPIQLIAGNHCGTDTFLQNITIYSSYIEPIDTITPDTEVITMLNEVHLEALRYYYAYPNLFININESSVNPQKLYVYDISGRIVQQVNITHNSKKQSIYLPLQNGIYVMEIIDQNAFNYPLKVIIKE